MEQKNMVKWYPLCNIYFEITMKRNTLDTRIQESIRNTLLLFIYKNSTLGLHSIINIQNSFNFPTLIKWKFVGSYLKGRSFRGQKFSRNLFFLNSTKFTFTGEIAKINSANSFDFSQSRKFVPQKLKDRWISGNRTFYLEKYFWLK